MFGCFAVAVELKVNMPNTIATKQKFILQRLQVISNKAFFAHANKRHLFYQRSIKGFGPGSPYQIFIESSNNRVNSASPASIGDSLVTRCWGSVP